MSAALRSTVVKLPAPPRLLVRYRGYAFLEERFSWLRGDPDAERLFELHRAEASADLSVPLGINWSMFEQIELAGIEACVTVRKHNRLVGYIAYIIASHTHYGMTIAADDSYFLDPEHRHGWLGIRLFRVAERLLRERGVDEIHTRIKLHVRHRGRDLAAIFKYLGYKPTETNFRKRIA